jgi:uncharacterized membrane protein
MSRTHHSIEVNAPIALVYNQWLRFDEFPRFMETVEEIRRKGETRLFWRTRIGGMEKSWEAEITSQIPYKQIAWASVDGTQNAGVVTFEELAPERTKVKVIIDYQLEGILEKAGDAFGIPSNRVEGDLVRFREYIEQKFKECGFNHDGAEIDSPSQFYRDVAVPNQPAHEEIAVRAYELFLKRGLAPDHEVEDWLQAEKELVNEKKPQK